ncbi:MAG: HAD family hydrolase [Prevotella sp.]
MPTNPIRLIILDFDGTLADTSRVIIATMQATFKQMNMTIPNAEQVKSVIGLPLKECFTHLMPMDDDTAGRCTETTRDIFGHKNQELAPKPCPNVDSTLHRLHNDGLSLAIASSRSTRSLEEFIDRFGWNGLFSDVIGADKVTKAKPHPEPVERILADLHFLPKDAVVVGDAPYDIMMGTNASTRTCAVTYGNAQLESLSEAKPDWVIDDFEKIESLILQQNGKIK